MSNTLKKVIFEVRSPVAKAQLIGAIAGVVLPLLVGALCFIFAAGFAGLPLLALFTAPAHMLCYVCGYKCQDDAAHLATNLWLVGITDAFVGFLLGTAVGLCVRSRAKNKHSPTNGSSQ